MRVSAEVKLILSVHPGQRTEQQLAKVSISFLSINGRTLEQNKTQDSRFCFLDSSAFSELSSDSIGLFEVFSHITPMILVYHKLHAFRCLEQTQGVCLFER